MKSTKTITKLVHLTNESASWKGGAQKIIHLIHDSSKTPSSILSFDEILETGKAMRQSSALSCLYHLILDILFSPASFYVIHHRIFIPLMIILRIERFVFVCHSIFPNKNYFFRFMGKSKCIAVSPEVRNFLHSHNKKLDVHVIENGISSPEGEMWVKSSDSTFRIGYVGRISKEKGIFDLVNAFHKYQLNTNPCSQLYLVGDGPERSNILDLINSLELSKQVHFLGRLEHPFASLNKMNVIVVPSHFEGFGLVYLEALVRNHLVIATSLEVFTKKAIKNRTLFFIPNSAEDLTEKLIQAEKLSEQHREIDTESAFDTNFCCTSQDMIRNYFEYFQDLTK